MKVVINPMRCPGISVDKHAFVPQCGSCLRRVGTTNDEVIEPPKFETECPQRIGAEE